ncbi:NUDIX domain-containing protein [Candidatus Wolfebacteria bacterium]|nr:NUDIX domain-containing protein [Candidatus Wolfebacteria bacterium]
MREISAGIIIYRKTPRGIKFLILYHGNSYWNFAKGKIESEEKSWQTAVREIREETGLRISELKFKKNFKAYEKFSFWRGKERVLKIVIFYLAETKQPRVVLSHEHEGYGWFTYREAMRILGKYKDSQRILTQANQIVERGSAATTERS